MQEQQLQQNEIKWTLDVNCEEKDFMLECMKELQKLQNPKKPFQNFNNNSKMKHYEANLQKK